MLGAIAGDVIGSVHEFVGRKDSEFDLFVPDTTFTDDTVLAVAVADCLLNGLPYAETLRSYAVAYPMRGYGIRFGQWVARGDGLPYNSYGNGSAMRVPAVGYAFDTLEAVAAEAERAAAVTHNHPEGIKGAQATAVAVLLARQGEPKSRIKNHIERSFGYNLRQRYADIQPDYRFDESCQGTVPAALIAFLESDDFEDAIRKAIALGGDADTLACIAGGVAEPFYGGVPPHIAGPTLERLDGRLRAVVATFAARFCS